MGWRWLLDTHGFSTHTHVQFRACEVSGVFPGVRPPELNLSQVPADSFSHLLGHEFSNVLLNYSPGAR